MGNLAFVRFYGKIAQVPFFLFVREGMKGYGEIEFRRSLPLLLITLKTD